MFEAQRVALINLINAHKQLQSVQRDFFDAKDFYAHQVESFNRVYDLDKCPERMVLAVSGTAYIVTLDLEDGTGHKVEIAPCSQVDEKFLEKPEPHLRTSEDAWIYCPRCGQHLSIFDEICPKCGIEIKPF